MNDDDTLYLEPSTIKILSKRLHDINDWIAEALDDVVARDTARERNDGGKSADTPVPFNDKAGDMAIELAGTLQVWVDSVCTNRRRLVWPGRMRSKGSAKWLKEHIIDLALCDDAAQAFDEITDARARAIRWSDVPEAREFIGPCQAAEGLCEGVYCRPRADIHHCRSCGLDIDVPSLKATTEEELRVRLFDAEQLQDALTIVGKKRIHKRTIESWIESGRLVSKGGKYKLADAMELLAAHTTKTRGKRKTA